MDTGDLLEKLKMMAIADADLRAKLLATRGSDSSLGDFCRISTEVGVPLNKMDMIEFGESSYAAMFMMELEMLL